MAMEDLMRALMQSASGAAQAPQQQQQSGGGDMLSQVIGGLMGGAQQSGGQQSGGGDMMSQVLGGLMGATQQAGAQQGGGNMMSQVIGGLLGGAQGGPQGGGAGDQMLGALEQIIGGTPGAGHPMNMNPAGGVNMADVGMNNPIMGLIQPVVNQLAAKANISPQIAMVVASIAVHYLLSSHPSTSNRAPMDLGNVMQQLSTGSISPDMLHNSGMVSDVMQATGLNKQQAVKSLDTTFGVLGAHVKGTVGRTTN